MRSLTTTKVQDLSKASANSSQEKVAGGIAVQSLPAVHPYSHDFNKTKPIQMVGQLTTHPGLDQSVLVGGGPNVSTNTQVNTIATQGTKSEIHAAIKCLKNSYRAREDIIKHHFDSDELRRSPDGQSHAQRIKNEKNWESQLEQALLTRFPPVTGGGGASSGAAAVVIQQPPPKPKPKPKSSRQ